MFNFVANLNVSSGITKTDVAPPAGAVYATNGPRSGSNGGFTIPQLVWNGATSEWFTSKINAGAPIDTTGGHIFVSVKRLSNTFATSASALDLFSEGDPAAPGANYHTINLIGDGGGYEGMNTEFGKGYGISKFSAVGTGANLTAITFARMRITTATGTTLYPVSIDFVKPAAAKTSVIHCSTVISPQTSLEKSWEPICQP